MTLGQAIGKLVGHLLSLAGAVLALWAIGRFFFIGNEPNDAVLTVLFFIYGSAAQGLGMILVWVAGGDDA